MAADRGGREALNPARTQSSQRLKQGPSYLFLIISSYLVIFYCSLLSYAQLFDNTRISARIPQATRHGILPVAVADDGR